MIRLTVPSMERADVEAVSDVLRTGYLVQGEHVRRFEIAVGAAVGAPHTIAVSSGTAALHVALLSLGIGPGDCVAVPTYSWPATANVVRLCGAEPVFVDIQASTMNMDPTQLASVLRSRSVKVVLPVHAFGGMADMRAILTVSRAAGAIVVEDAACALGAMLDGVAAGAWGTIGCFSFHPRKVVTTGEGGMVVTASEELARSCRELRNHGITPDTRPPVFHRAGFNYRLTDFQGALGVVQLSRLAALVEARRAIAERYDRLLGPLGLVCPSSLQAGAHVYQAYVVLLPPGIGRDQGRVIERMRHAGVEVTLGTYHIPLTSYWAEAGAYREGDFPVTDDVARRAVALPLYPQLTEKDQDEVVRALGLLLT